jgi:alpha-1,2-mannosyltransferase
MSDAAAAPRPVATRADRVLGLVPWVAGAVAVVIALGRLLRTDGDIGIYLDAARELVAGGVDIHRDRVEVGPFLYPHVAALPFVLLHELLGDRGARIAWCVLLGLSTVWLLRSVARCAVPFGGLRWWQWAVFALLFQRCIAQNLSHGQLSLVVGTLVTAGTACLVGGRDVRGGVWLGLAAALKLTPALFVVVLPFLGRTRAAVAMAATAAVAVLLVPWPVCGTDEHVRHLRTFAAAVHASLADPATAAITQYYAGPSVRGALDHLLQPRPVDRDGHTVNVLAVGDGTLRVVRGAWSLALAALLAAWCWRARRLPPPQRIAHQASAIAIAQCVFAPLLRTYHLAAAMVPFALFCRGPRGRRDALWWTAAGLVLVALTARQRNVLGETLWRAFDGGAMLHLALVLLVAWSVREAGPAREGSA